MQVWGARRGGAEAAIAYRKIGQGFIRGYISILVGVYLSIHPGVYLCYPWGFRGFIRGIIQSLSGRSSAGSEGMYISRFIRSYIPEVYPYDS